MRDLPLAGTWPHAVDGGPRPCSRCQWHAFSSWADTRAGRQP